uniref:Uncharacterized protein n=1 Tax=Anguilla anguilla TaxID=7936 RepID=A0A0E9UYP2_ANGAN
MLTAPTGSIGTEHFNLLIYLLGEGQRGIEAFWPPVEMTSLLAL